MQDAGIGPRCDDAAVGGVLAAVATKLVQQLGIQMVFAHVGPSPNHLGTGLHGSHMGVGADAGGAAHEGLLVCVFHQPHLVQEAAQVLLPLGAQRPIAHPRTHLLQPARDAGFQSGMNGKREPQRLAVFQQARQLGIQLRHRMGGAQAQLCDCGFWPQAQAVPNFALHVFGLAKQGALAFGGDDQPRIRLGEPGQVIKITVVAIEEIAVAVAWALGRSRNDGDATRAQLRRELGTTTGIDISGRGG